MAKPSQRSLEAHAIQRRSSVCWAVTMTRILIVKGIDGVKSAWEENHRSGALILLGPVSRVFLLHEDLLREIYDRYEKSLVIPSSYDDVAIYVNMRKLGYRICRGSDSYGDTEIHCLERGEKPWARMILRRDNALSLFFSEDLDPVDLSEPYAATPSRAKGNIIYVSYGSLGSSGMILSRWISLRTDPFEDLRALIEIRDNALTIDIIASRYRASLRMGLG